jgi:hypothetical protein
MVIFILTSDSDRIPVSISNKITVLTLHFTIYDIFGIRVHLQRLIFEGKYLHLYERLEDLGICHFSEIYLEVCESGSDEN